MPGGVGIVFVKKRCSLRLELRTCCDESLAGFVASVLHKVLLEACCQVFSLLLPLCCVSISIARVKNICIHALKLCGNSEVEDRNVLCRSIEDSATEDSVDDTACVADRDTLACSVPAGVYEVCLGTALLHLLNQFLSVLCGVQFEECLAEASRECGSGLCDAAFRTCQLGCEA